MNLAQHILVLILRLYRLAISPALAALTVPLGMGCRFAPTCSHYALEAIQRHGAARGGWLALRRLLRCHPWGDCGPDPVPPEHATRHTMGSVRTSPAAATFAFPDALNPVIAAAISCVAAPGVRRTPASTSSPPGSPMAPGPTCEHGS